MKKILSALAVVSFIGISNNAFAATSSGSLAVTGSITSSIAFTVEAAGGNSPSGLGTNAASTALGSVSKSGSAPTGFTLTPAASSWTLASNVDVKVVKANSSSATYTLSAQLASAPATGVAWSLNSVALSGTVASLTVLGAYDATPSYPWTIVVQDSAASGSFNNTINFVATSN
jgi:hypothetical protein